jgi:hypothetical protein
MLKTRQEKLERLLSLRRAVRARRVGERGRLKGFETEPSRFVQTVLGEHLWSKQREIADAVAVHRRVAVQSAHDVGKSFLAARVVAWWLSCWPAGEAFVVTTAPTFPQVKFILWKEIARAHRKGRLPGRTNQVEWWIENEIVAYVSTRTKAALAAAKARGVKLGNPRLLAGSRESAHAAAMVRSRASDSHAQGVAPYIADARRAGCVSLIQLAAAMTARGIRAPGGGVSWRPEMVRRVLARISISK